jgi:hypothetical protein
LKRETNSGAGATASARPRDVVGQDVLRNLWERHRRFRAALALNPPKPQAGRDIPDVEGDNFRASEPAEAHERYESFLTHIGALLQYRLDHLPTGYPRQPCLAAWPRQHVDRVSGYLVPPHGPLAEAPQRRQPHADAAGLQPPRRQVVLVGPTGPSREMGHQHGPSELLHHE